MSYHVPSDQPGLQGLEINVEQFKTLRLSLSLSLTHSLSLSFSHSLYLPLFPQITIITTVLLALILA